jgi:hypothetical protein
MIKSAEEKPRLEQVKDRRSHADGDRLTAELFRRGDHPDEFTDVWTAGPSLSLDPPPYSVGQR